MFDIEELAVHTNADGFVDLRFFAQKIFKLSANDLSTFFDYEGRFYPNYEKHIKNIKHNVTFTAKYTKDGRFNGRIVSGGVHIQDLSIFIKIATLLINRNSEELEKGYQQYRQSKKELE